MLWVSLQAGQVISLSSRPAVSSRPHWVEHLHCAATTSEPWRYDIAPTSWYSAHRPIYTSPTGQASTSSPAPSLPANATERGNLGHVHRSAPTVPPAHCRMLKRMSSDSPLGDPRATRRVIRMTSTTGLSQMLSPCCSRLRYAFQQVLRGEPSPGQRGAQQCPVRGAGWRAGGCHHGAQC